MNLAFMAILEVNVDINVDLNCNSIAERLLAMGFQRRFPKLFSLTIMFSGHTPQRQGSVGKPSRALSLLWCPGTELNCRHGDFQSPALPTELPGPKQQGVYMIFDYSCQG